MFALLLIASVFSATKEKVEAQQIRKVSSCRFDSPPLVISFLNVGQGDATLIRCPDGKHQALIDGGESSERYPGAERLFKEALAERMGNDSVIEVGITTHPHQDHLFNFKHLLHNDPQKLRLEKFYDNGADNPDSSLEEELRGLAEKAGIPYARLDSGKGPLEICPGSDSALLFF